MGLGGDNNRHKAQGPWYKEEIFSPKPYALHLTPFFGFRP